MRRRGYTCDAADACHAENRYAEIRVRCRDTRAMQRYACDTEACVPRRQQKRRDTRATQRICVPHRGYACHAESRVPRGDTRTTQRYACHAEIRVPRGDTRAMQRYACEAEKRATQRSVPPREACNRNVLRPNFLDEQPVESKEEHLIGRTPGRGADATTRETKRPLKVCCYWNTKVQRALYMKDTLKSTGAAFNPPLTAGGTLC